MNSCAELRTTLGVYVLGAIDPAERGRLEGHLESCPACRDELAGLAGLPALLGRVDEAQIAQIAGPPEELLDALLARAAEESNGRAWRLFGSRGSAGEAPGGRGRGGGWLGRWTPLLVAASVLLVVGVLLGMGVMSAVREDERPSAAPTVTVTPPPPVPPKAERVTASSPDGKLQAQVMLTKRKSGTSVEFYLRGAPYGTRCRLFAVAKDGQRDALGSWYVAYSKGYGKYYGSTMFQRDQLFSFEVVTVEGQPLLTIPT